MWSHFSPTYQNLKRACLHIALMKKFNPEMWCHLSPTYQKEQRRKGRNIGNHREQIQNSKGLTRHCVKKTYVIYKLSRYRRTEAAPIDSPLSTSLVNFFMEDPDIWLEESARLNASSDSVMKTTHSWFGNIKRTKNKFLNDLNSRRSKLMFTSEQPYTFHQQKGNPYTLLPDRQITPPHCLTQNAYRDGGHMTT